MVSMFFIQIYFSGSSSKSVQNLTSFVSPIPLSTPKRFDSRHFSSDQFSSPLSPSESKLITHSKLQHAPFASGSSQSRLEFSSPASLLGNGPTAEHVNSIPADTSKKISPRKRRVDYLSIAEGEFSFSSVSPIQKSVSQMASPAILPNSGPFPQFSLSPVAFPITNTDNINANALYSPPKFVNQFHSQAPISFTMSPDPKPALNMISSQEKAPEPDLCSQEILLDHSKDEQRIDPDSDFQSPQPLGNAYSEEQNALQSRPSSKVLSSEQSDLFSSPVRIRSIVSSPFSPISADGETSRTLPGSPVSLLSPSIRANQNQNQTVRCYIPFVLSYFQ